MGPSPPRTNKVVIASVAICRELWRWDTHHVGGSCESHIARNLGFHDVAHSNELHKNLSPLLPGWRAEGSTWVVALTFI